MTRTFVELPIFRARWKDMGLTDDDLKRLQEELLADPKVGAVMRGTGGVRKMRFAFEHKRHAQNVVDCDRNRKGNHGCEQNIDVEPFLEYHKNAHIHKGCDHAHDSKFE